MPKVSDDYTASKKEFILQCVNEVYQEKPLHQIIMRDVIKKTGFSQGAVYRYYANLDEIYIELVNRNTTEYQLEHEIDRLLCAGLNEADTIAGCILAIGTYIHELLKLSAGKMYFELLIAYAHDVEKCKRIFPRLKFKKSLAYAQQKTVEYLIQNVQNGVFQLTIPLESLISFTSVAVDGISSDAILSIARQSDEPAVFTVDILKLFDVLAKAVVGFLEQPKGEE